MLSIGLAPMEARLTGYHTALSLAFPMLSIGLAPMEARLTSYLPALTLALPTISIGLAPMEARLTSYLPALSLALPSSPSGLPRWKRDLPATSSTHTRAPHALHRACPDGSPNWRLIKPLSPSHKPSGGSAKESNLFRQTLRFSAELHLDCRARTYQRNS